MDCVGDETPLKTKLKGSIREQIGGACKVRLSGRNRRGRVEIEGAIGSATFDGTIIRMIGKEKLSEKVSLKRKLDASPERVG
jgi:hypothetical protein